MSFDHLDHHWMMEWLSQCITDRRFKSLIDKMLKSGVLQEGTVQATDEGTPQGGILTPLTKWHTCVFGVALPQEGIHPKDHLHLRSRERYPLHERPANLTVPAPLPCLHVLGPLGGQFIQASQEQVQVPLPRFCLGQLPAWDVTMGHALPEPRAPRLECLLADSALGLTAEEASHPVAPLA
jgi:hypothetical protein